MDPIADFLTRIRNGLSVRRKEVRVPFSKMKHEIARILLEEGYISNFQVDGEGTKKMLLVTLKYNEDGSSVIRGLERVSRQSRRVYVSADSIPQVLGGLGLAVLSTSRGIMTGREAERERIGGELVCKVW
ncbi:MAG: 30S ribosomal protein S8 [candidate division WOR-3 bacterium]